MESQVSRIRIPSLPSIKTSNYNIAESAILLNEKESKQAEFLASEDEKAELSLSSAPSSDTDSLIAHLAKDYEHDRRHFKRIFFCINLIAIALLAIIGYILGNWLKGMNFHPDASSDADYNIHLVCLVIGSLILPAYGMLIFRVFPQVPHQTLVNFHIAINIIGLLLSVFGIKVGYDAHHLYAQFHLYSLHSWFGFTIFIMQFFELITGNWLFFRNFSQPILQYCHSLVGTIIFIWSGAATISGLLYRAQLLIRNGSMRQNIQFTLNSFGVLANIFTILVRYLCSEHKYRRRARPERTKSKSKATGQSANIADPFAQDTFEYGTVRKSVFIGSQSYQKYSTSVKVAKDHPHAAPSIVPPGHALRRTPSQFYLNSARRAVLTRMSITDELDKLSQKRESYARKIIYQATEDLNDGLDVDDEYSMPSSAQSDVV